MSSTSLVEFKDGVADECHEFCNSWGGAARIWDALFETYIPKKHEYDMWMTAAQDERLWQVWKDERLRECERIAYWFCCDNALVKRENFAAMASALREFATLHPVPGKVCHLEAYAKVFDSAKCDAIGLHATSVCENPWYEWDQEKDESVPYNFLTGGKHWFVFDRATEVAAT